MKKCNTCNKIIENEEIQNVKKTFDESTISESTPVVVVKNMFLTHAVPQREAKHKKHVIPTLGGNDGRRPGGTTTIIYKK